MLENDMRNTSADVSASGKGMPGAPVDYPCRGFCEDWLLARMRRGLLQIGLEHGVGVGVCQRQRAPALS